MEGRGPVPLGMPCALATAVGLIATAPATAQQSAFQASATYSLFWREVDRATGLPSSSTPGQIDPTEAVRLILNISFSPAVGSTIAYLPASPPPGFGTVGGWVGSAMELDGAGGTLGSFTQFSAAPGFALLSIFPEPGGLNYFGVRNPGIFSPDPLDPTNPIPSLISFTWTPADYSPRSVGFSTADPPEGLAHSIGVRVTPATGAPFNLPCLVPAGRITHANTGSIPIVPSPGGLAVLGGLGICFGKRRR